ncbi:SPOSA6832_03248, partial [Sporobolomyces salmonicolor]
MLSSLATPASFESAHVHAVYDEIASDFSRTRHSRWPFVEHFLDQLDPGSIVLDAGTGNGKYLGCRSVLNWEGKADEGKPRGKGKGKAVEPAQAEKEDVPTRKSNVLNVGFDMSAGLLGIASAKGHEVVRGDCVDLSCWRRGAFDHAISIATVHHFATPERRTEAIKVSDALPPESQLLVVVWSLEQDPSLLGARSARRTTGGKKGAIPVSSTSQAEKEESQDTQDVFVPWERQEQQVKQPKPPRRARGTASAPLNGSPSAPSTSPPSGPATDSARLSASALPAASPADSPPSTPPSDSPAPRPPVPNPKPTFNRYYHLFRQYELSCLVQSAANQLGFSFSAPDDYPVDKSSAFQKDKQGWEVQVRIKEERWERENWVVEAGVAWRRASGSSPAPE